MGLKTSPPAREPLKAGSLLEGVPFDPVLASVYARLGHAVFATKVIGLVLTQSNDEAHGVEEKARWWREEWWKDLGEPVIVFAGDVYAYAAVPGLADAHGRQPVVMVDTYELAPKVMPIASNVDRFFDTWARYLEAKVSHSPHKEVGGIDIRFPWDATEILARDERLVELMRAGRFDSLMKNVDNETRRWAAKVMGTHM
ncbi:hypothetical protein [Vitiosangium sp. GDMCC 1.1324]|uniref:hypothetical protein n=1 Tax=Vitiosangium sp. (strain GDMCC 1.1324) TaxID=2138576 RepID=UPI00130D6730|nr:hypothetical protein [Vitiosangium sp. GDMCC 1.1324]